MSTIASFAKYYVSEERHKLRCIVINIIWEKSLKITRHATFRGHRSILQSFLAFASFTHAVNVYICFYLLLHHKFVKRKQKRYSTKTLQQRERGRQV